MSGAEVALQVAILGAGMGTRLGRPFPKPLVHLSDGSTILRQQVQHLRDEFGDDCCPMVVVGFKYSPVMEEVPDLLFVYNELYDQTNTSKSLLKALLASRDGGLLWLNGDLAFDRQVLALLRPHLLRDETFVCVNAAAVGEEEVKYSLDATGHISELSKSVLGGLGEAVGINSISSRGRSTLVRHLGLCQDTDYFEQGLEMAIEKDGVRVTPVDISRFAAVEVDFPEDLARANELV
jgi:choline kinase